MSSGLSCVYIWLIQCYPGTRHSMAGASIMSDCKPISRYGAQRVIRRAPMNADSYPTSTRYPYPHFTGGETKAERLKHQAEVTELKPEKTWVEEMAQLLKHMPTSVGTSADSSNPDKTPGMVTDACNLSTGEARHGDPWK